MFRSQSLEAVRQQQYKAAQSAPLGLTATYEKIDCRLGVVGEITKLSLPHDQTIRLGKGIAIFESHYPGLRKETVIGIEFRLAVIQGC